MFVKLKSAAILGLDCLPVDVEIDINKGQTSFNIVGLPDTSIQEAKARIYSALKNSDFSYPFNFRILINLAPADRQKEGPAYDLPMAIGIITISNNLKIDFTNKLLAGELALDGSLRHINGVLPLAIFAKESGLKEFFIPATNALEASMVSGLEIYPVKNIKELVDHFLNIKKITPFEKPKNWNTEYQEKDFMDMSMVKGQESAKRALEIAASGGHNILMNGPPGSGKTLLSRTLPSILPRLSEKESLEVTKIYSVAGLLQEDLVRTRPFRTPHHTASSVALVGGGRIPRPGEISLAHRGVLFLDEFPEFPRIVLESLRQPLEDGIITISRAQGTLTFPAQFILVASQNPCPCGYATDPDQQCTCSPMQAMRYKKKVSGPLLDRIDLHIDVPRVKFDKLTSDEISESSKQIRERVEEARERQNFRFKNLEIRTNSEMSNNEIKKDCKLDNQSMDLLRAATNQMHLSARSYNRILKLSRTIADLAKSDNIKMEHIAEALQYRSKND